MITLYAMGSPNVTRVFIALEELALPYSVEPVDVFAGKQYDPEFLKVNPNAKVPVIVDPDGPAGKPYTCFESGAILLYLADKTGKLLPADKAARFDAIQWLMTQKSTVGPMFGQFVHFMRFAPAGNDYAKTRYKSQALRVTEVIDQRLAAVPYLAGSEYSVADIATLPWMRNIPALLGAQYAARYPNVQRWIKELEARPAVQRGIAAADAVRSKTTAFDKADPDHMDRFVSRGRYAIA
jgi:GSH-dependent disulfide-bond oxidoreductase